MSEVFIDPKLTAVRELHASAFPSGATLDGRFDSTVELVIPGQIDELKARLERFSKTSTTGAKL